MMADRLDERYLYVIRLLHDRIAGASLNWALTGSVALALRGIYLSPPGDIDVQTDEAGAYEIERQLAEYSVRPVQFSEAERIRSHFGALQIEGVTVEIMGDIQHRQPDGTWTEPVEIAAEREWVEIDGLRLPVLSLAYEAEAYGRIGREESARRLHAWTEALVRPATIQDAPGIARVHVDAWRETYQGVLPADFLQNLSYESREEQWRRALSDPASRTRLFVVQEKGGPIGGFAAVGPERGEMEGYGGELYAIYLLRQYQGLGHGRRLFEAGAKALVDEGFRSMVLWVLEENLTRGFYEHLGGSVVAQKMFPVGGVQYPAVAYGWDDMPAGQER